MDRENARPPHHKMKFTPEEDDLIRELMMNGRSKSWTVLAQKMPHRTARQIRERWINYLDPTVNTTTWTSEEEMLLDRLVAQYGPKWSKMVSELGNRSDINIKNHYLLMQRRQQKTLTAVACEAMLRKGSKPRGMHSGSATARTASEVGMEPEIQPKLIEWDEGFEWYSREDATVLRWMMD
jgi:hypothetical protein